MGLAAGLRAAQAILALSCAQAGRNDAPMPPTISAAIKILRLFLPMKCLRQVRQNLEDLIFFIGNVANRTFLSNFSCPRKFVVLDFLKMVPKKVFFTKGVGVHKEKLASFEMALRVAGLAHCNLCLVSSIYPP